jgi:hypothetical protein
MATHPASEACQGLTPSWRISQGNFAWRQSEKQMTALLIRETDAKRYSTFALLNLLLDRRKVICQNDPRQFASFAANSALPLALGYHLNESLL